MLQCKIIVRMSYSWLLVVGIANTNSPDVDLPQSAPQNLFHT